MYSKDGEQLRAKEFPTLKDVCYLDHTGATLYAKSQIAAVSKDLLENVYGNPHSLSLSSRYCSDVIDQVRYRVLQHFNASPEEYSVVFTSGATGALKLVAECFDWKGNKPCKCVNSDTLVKSGSKQNVEESRSAESASCDKCRGTFVYLQDNHTSVLGMRELAHDKGAYVHCLSHDDAFKIFDTRNSISDENSYSSHCINSLFVYPAQCNFSGLKYPQQWIEKVQNGVLNKIITPSENCNAAYSRWFCFLDAATYVSTNSMDLSIIKPDFVCVSFYKMFGYPTGLGALLVKNSCADVLKKSYFGGGTVLISLASERYHISRPDISDRFEDGTLPFLSIAALQHGFNTLSQLTGGMVNIARHTFSLARYVHHRLLQLHHANGSPVAVLYSDTDYEDISTQGNIVNFNLLRSNKEFIGFMEVLNMANLYGVHLRTGCFCNPGACQRHLDLSVEELRKHFQAGHVCGDERDLIDGQPTGSIRISFGYMSSKIDADKFLEMITTCFVDGPCIIQVPQWWKNFQKLYQQKFSSVKLNSNAAIGDIESVMWNTHSNIELCLSENEDFMFETNNSVDDNTSVYDATSITMNGIQNNTSTEGEGLTENSDLRRPSQSDKTLTTYLSHIFLYPIKSCAAMSVKSWPIGPRGLIYDREWMIVTPSGVSLTQKQDTKLCLIQPKINCSTRRITLHFPGMDSISLPLDQVENLSHKQASLCQSKVCGDRVQCWDCGDKVAEWLSLALGREGLRLIRQWHSDQRMTKTKHKKDITDEKLPSLSLSNQAQFLLVNMASINWLAERLEEETDCCKEGLLERFRSNLVVEGFQAFHEKEWTKLSIGSSEFAVDGLCTRCQMICIDQATGERTQEPLRTLSAAFHGKMRFGIYLRCESKDVNISVGDNVDVFL